MQDFRNLGVWAKAHRLTLAVYRVTARFPPAERWGFQKQLRRAAVSIPANIAEGCGRNTDAQLALFCNIAMGSASELEYHIPLAKDLEYLPSVEYQTLNDSIVEVKKMLSALIKRLKQ